MLYDDECVVFECVFVVNDVCVVMFMWYWLVELWCYVCMFVFVE